MRYVILIFAVTMFIVWESLYGDWVITEAVFAEIERVWNQLTG